jgi:hypothetical protein
LPEEEFPVFKCHNTTSFFSLLDYLIYFCPSHHSVAPSIHDTVSILRQRRRCVAKLRVHVFCHLLATVEPSTRSIFLHFRRRQKEKKGVKLDIENVIRIRTQSTPAKKNIKKRNKVLKKKRKKKKKKTRNIPAIIIRETLGDALGSALHEVCQCNTLFHRNFAHVDSPHFAITFKTFSTIRDVATRKPHSLRPLNTSPIQRMTIILQKKQLFTVGFFAFSPYLHKRVPCGS